MVIVNGPSPLPYQQRVAGRAVERALAHSCNARPGRIFFNTIDEQRWNYAVCLTQWKAQGAGTVALFWGSLTRPSLDSPSPVDPVKIPDKRRRHLCA
jgi:hypothetical protein